MSHNMSRGSANPSDRGSSPRTRRHSGLSPKNAELILRQLKNIQADVERIGEGFRTSLRDIKECIEDKTMGAESSQLEPRATKRGLDMSNSFASIKADKADTAEIRKDSAELRVESQETRRRVALLQGDIGRTNTCVNEITSVYIAPAATAIPQTGATQAAAKVREESSDSV